MQETATVIVAIPPVGDRIHKISSEEVPHLTLLYLGNVELSAEAVLYVQHAVQELSPFGLSVDHRGTLGEDEADVLFFESNAWDLKRVSEFRHYLLLNDEIKKAYDAADQYPEWTPHLTLGYPQAPAKDNDEDDYHRLRYIDFDRIAVWSGEFEGPEFRLEYDDYATMGDVAMSDISTTERGEQAVAELFHYGVKGMKWGVRKSERTQARATALKERSERRSGKLGSAAEARKGAKLQKEADRQRRREDKLGERGAIRRGATKANVALDAGAKIIREGEKKLIFLPHKNRQAAASRTQTRMLAAARRVNQQKQFKGKDIKNNPNLKRSYFDKLKEEAKTIYAEELDISRTEAWGEFLGVDTTTATNQMRINVAVDKIRHADEETETLLELNFIEGPDGFVTDIEVPDKYLKHELFEDNEYTLVHYGVKGMRWGVTTKSDGSVSVDQTKVRKSLRRSDRAVTVTQRKPGTYVKAKGGKRNVASTDAVRAQAGRQKAKKSTTDALSNKELKDTIERMRLEQEYTKLNKKVSRRGQSFVSRFLQSPEAKQTAEDLLKKASSKAA